MLSTVKGIVAPTVEAQAEEPTVQIQVDLAKAEKYGIKPGDVRRASATFFAGPARGQPVRGAEDLRRRRVGRAVGAPHARPTSRTC